MSVEIERKFLLAGNTWRDLAPGKEYRQGYVRDGQGCTVRVRSTCDQGYLTIKGSGNGISRLEYEYEIPVEEADAMLDQLCRKPIIEKTRYTIPYAGFIWEVDEFHGENQGLIVAEIELEFEEQPFEKPEWVGEEVTGDVRYFNACLAKHPFSQW
ncbi:MAG: adenylate cyclase [Desulfobulbus propionicus]|nr:MAG: adenylate cyclase [Desulfobulbus propionicus]